MKLRNKKTGKIVPASNIAVGVGDDGEWYDSLSKLNEEWEDYKPKEHWFVSEFGKVYCVEDMMMDKHHIKWLKELGNYFNTKEDAELAVRRLKAWKKLKDKGLKNIAWGWHKINNPCREDDGKIYIKVLLDTETYDCSWDDDLDLLFGGVE